MERGSDKHSPEIDDQMKRESEPLERGMPHGSRIEESRTTEGPGEGERGGEPVHATIQDVPSRTDLARFVQPSVFPADRDALLGSAHQQQAPGDVLDAFGRLPSGRVFEDISEVWETLSADSR